jgi:hypothetical protein
VIAKAQVALPAMEFSCDLGLQSIVLKGDFLLVVKAIQVNNSNWCRYEQLVANIQVVLSIQRSWQIIHI